MKTNLKPNSGAIGSLKELAMAAACAGIVLGGFVSARATTMFWDLNPASSAWTTAANWNTNGVDAANPAAYPGTGDVATFNTNSSITTIGTAVTAGNMVFDAGAGAFTIGTGAVDSQTYIMAGATTLQMANGVANNQIFNTKLQIGGNGGAATYAITNNSATANTFTFNGSIIGGSTGTQGTKNLMVGGTAGVSFKGALTKGGAASIQLTKMGSGTLILSNAATVIDFIQLDGGTIDLAKDITLGSSGASTLKGSGGSITSTGGGRILLGAGATTNGEDWTATALYTNVINAVIADGAGNSVDFYNTGTIILKGANTFSGRAGLYGTAVQIGVDGVGAAGAITSGAFGIGTISIQAGANVSSDGTTPRSNLNAMVFASNLTIGDATRNGRLTFAGNADLGGSTRTLTLNSEAQFDGVISNGAVTKAGSATLVFTAANAYTNTTVSSGRLVAANTAALGASGRIVTFGGGTVDFATDSSANAYVLNLGSGTAGTVLVNRATSGTGITHIMGLPTIGNAMLTVQAGTNVANGTPTLQLNGISLSAGAVGLGTATLNPTTARISVVGGVARPGTQANSLTLDGTSTGNIISGVIAGALNLIKSNVSAWTLNATNVFTGTTLVSGGTLILSNNLALQNSPFDTSGAGTLDMTSVDSPTLGGLTGAGNVALPGNITNLTLNSVSGAALTYSGNLGGGAVGMTLTKNGANTQTLSGNNTYSGLTTINAGDLRIASAGAIGGTNILVGGLNNSALVLDGTVVAGNGKSVTINGGGAGGFFGALSSLTGNNEWQGDVVIGSQQTRIGAQAGVLTVSGAIGGGNAAWLWNATNFSLMVRNNTGTTIFSGANNYLGDTAVSIGTLQLAGGNDRLPTGTKLVFGISGYSGALDLNGCNQQVAGLFVNSGITNEIRSASSATLTVNTPAGTPSAFSGRITGAINLVKTGPDTLALSGVNTYSGTTSVTQGQLAVVGILSTGAVGIASSAELAGTGEIGGSVNCAGTNSPGVAGVGKLTVGDYTQTSSGLLAVDIAASGSNDQLFVNGNATLDGTLSVSTNGYSPAHGDSFTILVTTGTLSGTLAATNLPALPAGFIWEVSYLPTSVVIGVQSMFSTIQLSSPDLAFGNVMTGTVANGTLTISNTGGQPLSVTNITYPAGFSGAWSGVVPSLGSTNVTVFFSPADMGSQGGIITLQSDASNGVSTISCSGTGVSAIVGVSGALAFGNVPTGTTVMATMTITNSGNIGFNVTNIVFPSGFLALWTGVVPAGSATNVTVFFFPDAVTNYSGTFIVESDANAGSTIIDASGDGVASVLGVTPVLDFGTVLTGATATATLTITNSGGWPLTVTNIACPAGFSGSWTGIVLAGAATNITISFSPLAATSYGGAGEIQSDAMNGSGLITFSGTGYVVIAGYSLWASAITNGLTNDNDCALGDGFPNLLKYATGSSATTPDNLAQMTATRSGGIFALKFNRDTNATDVTYFVEAADAAHNDAPWTGIATNSNGSWNGAPNITETGTNPVQVTASDTSPAASNRFLRLRVTRP